MVRATLWVDRHRIKQFQEIVSETGMRFVGNPIDCGINFHVCIQGENYAEFSDLWRRQTMLINEKDNRPGFIKRFFRRLKARIKS